MAYLVPRCIHKRSQTMKFVTSSLSHSELCLPSKSLQYFTNRVCKLIWAYVCYENYSLRKLNTSFLKRLKEHKENVHGIEYDKSHLNNVCEECGKVFESVKKLNRHRIDIHVNLAMMKCPHCPKEWSKNYIFKFNWVGINDTLILIKGFGIFYLVIFSRNFFRENSLQKNFQWNLIISSTSHGLSVFKYFDFPLLC